MGSILTNTTNKTLVMCNVFTNKTNIEFNSHSGTEQNCFWTENGCNREI